MPDILQEGVIAQWTCPKSCPPSRRRCLAEQNGHVTSQFCYGDALKVWRCHTGIESRLVLLRGEAQPVISAVHTVTTAAVLPASSPVAFTPSLHRWSADVVTKQALPVSGRPPASCVAANKGGMHYGRSIGDATMRSPEYARQRVMEATFGRLKPSRGARRPTTR